MCIRDRKSSSQNIVSVSRWFVGSSSSIISGSVSNSFTRASPVSYTHLDVYKRQSLNLFSVFSYYTDIIAASFILPRLVYVESTEFTESVG